jgi:hypothetical protein
MDTKKRALLTGNGINLLDDNQSLSWGKLLKEINTQNNTDIDFDNPFKPFPLAFGRLSSALQAIQLIVLNVEVVLVKFKFYDKYIMQNISLNNIF